MARVEVKMEKTIYNTFDALDPSGHNTERYKDMFSKMTDSEFDRFFKDFFDNEDEYLIWDIVDYERDATIEGIEKAAKVLNVPLFEHVVMPYASPDPDNPIATKYKVPVGYVHEKRVQQMVRKKNSTSTDLGELALGKNMVVAFMTFQGYNYEDAVILNERIVKDDAFTSLKIENYEIQCRDTKLGPEEITRDIHNVSEDSRKNLDANGIVKVGTLVKEGDILVGKVTPKGMVELTSEEKLLHAIFGEKTREVRDTSLRVEHGEGGIVHEVKITTKKDSDELPSGVNMVVRVSIIQKRKISVGDKMSGRHGNKGVISLILPQEDMPYMADGTPIDI